jgi:VIT1/CCC1 family predicted Fe2+/Mn2+ transporter
MGASNYLARRSTVEDELVPRLEAGKHGAATIFGFLAAGILPLLAYLLPLHDDARFGIAVASAAAALFAVGAARTLVTRRGLLRSGFEMLVVGSAAGAVAYAVGALAAAVT